MCVCECLHEWIFSTCVSDACRGQRVSPSSPVSNFWFWLFNTLKICSVLGVLAHTCHPATGMQSRTMCQGSEVTLGHSVSHARLPSDTLPQANKTDKQKRKTKPVPLWTPYKLSSPYKLLLTAPASSLAFTATGTVKKQNKINKPVKQHDNLLGPI